MCVLYACARARARVFVCVCVCVCVCSSFTDCFVAVFLVVPLIFSLMCKIPATFLENKLPNYLIFKAQSAVKVISGRNTLNEAWKRLILVYQPSVCPFIA